METRSADPQWLSRPPLYEHLGLRLKSLGGGKCTIELPYVPHFGNSRGEVHGGITASLLDATLSQAVRSTLEGPTNVATISLTLSYLGAAHGRLTSNGTVVREGRTIAFAEGEVIDEKGNAVCRAVATYRVLKPLKTA